MNSPAKIIFVFALLLLAGCNTTPEIKKTDPLESARGFIESSLKGNYDEAEQYILHDSTNLEYFNGMKAFNEKQVDKIKEGYKEANIIIDSINKISDSASVIHYSNTYKMEPSKLRMVRVKQEWLVDFKYTFLENN